jgi:Flp pilus assembly protein TadD
MLTRALSFILLLSLAVSAKTQQSVDSAEALSHRVSGIIIKIRTHPVDSAALEEAMQLGFNLLNAGDYERALTLFTAVTDVKRKEHRAMYGRTLALFNLGRIADAERDARTAIEASKTTEGLSPQAKYGEADALVLLGVVLAVKGDGASALAAVREAVALAPRNFDAQFALGRALYGAGDPQNAALAFQKAIALRPEDTKSRFFLATTLEASGDYDEARAAYTDLVKFHSDSAEGHLGLGVLLVKLDGQLTEEGIKELEKAISLNGDLYEARISLGRTLIKSGRTTEAVEHLTRAAQLAPNNPEPHYQLAIAYRRLGKKAEADQESARVKEINSSRRVTAGTKIPPEKRD